MRLSFWIQPISLHGTEFAKQEKKTGYNKQLKFDLTKRAPTAHFLYTPKFMEKLHSLCVRTVCNRKYLINGIDPISSLIGYNYTYTQIKKNHKSDKY